MSEWDQADGVQWHTLTVRFGTEGPLDASQIPAQPKEPQHAAAEMLRKVLGTDQGLLIDDVRLIRADVARVESEDVRLVSGHYWPCVQDGHPSDCPECRERHERDRAEFEETS